MKVSGRCDREGGEHMNNKYSRGQIIEPLGELAERHPECRYVRLRYRSDGMEWLLGGVNYASVRALGEYFGEAWKEWPGMAREDGREWEITALVGTGELTDGALAKRRKRHTVHRYLYVFREYDTGLVRGCLATGRTAKRARGAFDRWLEGREARILKGALVDSELPLSETMFPECAG